MPEDLCRDVYVEYQFYLDATKYKTEACSGMNRNPQFNYRHKHTVEIVTKMLVDYLEKDVMVFRVYGFADIKEKQKNNVKKPVTAKKPVTPVPSQQLADQSTDSSVNTSSTSSKIGAVSVNTSSQALNAGGMRGQPVVVDPLAAQRATGM